MDNIMKKMIAISAGHYPERPGACFEDFCEHGEAMQWALTIMRHMKGEGFYVPTGHLKNKVLAINNRNIYFAVEIHFNSFKVWKDANHDGIVTDDELMNAGEGCETLYYPGSEKGAFIANELQSAIAPALFRDRGIKPGYYRMNPKNGPDFFLAKTKCPAIILEPEFIHHKERIQDNRNITCELIAETLLSIQGRIDD